MECRFSGLFDICVNRDFHFAFAAAREYTPECRARHLFPISSKARSGASIHLINAAAIKLPKSMDSSSLPRIPDFAERNKDNRSGISTKRQVGPGPTLLSPCGTVIRRKLSVWDAIPLLLARKKLARPLNSLELVRTFADRLLVPGTLMRIYSDGRDQPRFSCSTYRGRSPVQLR